MDPTVLIASYADDVARRLPRRQRADVGLELRSLLADELAARADAAGAAPDEAMTLDLLRAFGRPQAVAERYRQDSFVIIRPSESSSFIWLALGGVALQWAVSLPAAFLTGAAPPAGLGDGLGRLEHWWLGPGLRAFWWPGLIVTITIAAAWIRAARPEAKDWAPPKALDPDRLSRPLTAVGLAAWAAYMALLAAAPALVRTLPPPLDTVFAFDEGFLLWRAPWLLAVWLIGFGVHLVAFLEGRWRQGTRTASRAAGLALCAVLGWFAAGGPIFQARSTDEITRGILLLVAVFTAAAVAAAAWRDLGLGRRPPGFPAR